MKELIPMSDVTLELVREKLKCSEDAPYVILLPRHCFRVYLNSIRDASGRYDGVSLSMCSRVPWRPATLEEQRSNYSVLEEMHRRTDLYFMQIRTLEDLEEAARMLGTLAAMDTRPD